MISKDALGSFGPARYIGALHLLEFLESPEHWRVAKQLSKHHGALVNHHSFDTSRACGMETDGMMIIFIFDPLMKTAFKLDSFPFTSVYLTLSR